MNIFNLQKRCVNCGKTYKLEKHHRIFRSEGEEVIKKFLEQFGFAWGLYDIQNEVILCKKCHTGRIHNGDRKLRDFFRYTYTDPNTGFNLPLEKKIQNEW